MINKSKIKIRIKMHRNLRQLSRNINLMMKKQTSYRAIWLLTILKMQKCSIKKMKKINKTKMERAKNLLKMNKIKIRMIQIMKCKMKIFKKLINKSLKILLILNNKKNEIKNKNKLKTLIKMMKMNK